MIPTISDPQKVRPVLNKNQAPSDLRAIGLSILLSSACGQKDHPHCRHENVLSELCHFLPEHLQSKPEMRIIICMHLFACILACYCNLAKEIGFDTTIMNRFKQIKTIWHQNIRPTPTESHKHYKKTSTTTVSVLVEDQMTTSIYFNEDETPIGHLFTFGEVSDVLKLCSYALSKEEKVGGSDDDEHRSLKVTEITESLKRKLVDFDVTMRSCDVHCISFSYRPIFEGESSGNKLDELISGSSGQAATKHVFLGLISVCPEPKEHFQEFIDDLEAAGVRFAYFSPYKEQQSKAFGERLGLETDWNSCILLSDHPNPSSQSPGYSALSDIKTKLPRGIQAIRPHLESVDDIPLHVSIFAECDPQNASEMIEIYQEAGEIVSAIGSLRSTRNSKCFSTAHLSIGYDPFTSDCEFAGDQYCTNISRCSNPLPLSSILPYFDEIASDINSNSIKLILPVNSSPYIITELIRESRTILQNSINSWEFVTGSLFTFILATLIYPFVLVDVLFIVFSVLLVGIGLMLGPHDAIVMKTHPTVLDSSKCPDQITFSFLFNCSLITIVRFLPSFISLMLTKSSPSSCLIVLLLQSFTFNHTYEPFKIKNITMNKKLAFIASTCIIVHAMMITGSLNIGSILISILLGCVCVTWHETIKSIHLKDHNDQLQKRSKLLFNTKLGMHSPI